MNGAVDFPLGQADLAFTASGGARVRRTVLPGGIRVLSENVPGARTATIGYWVAVGSRDEKSPGARPSAEASYGSTHFLEHLLFKGTTRRSALDIAVAFDTVGGEHNALTAKEFTCYYAKVLDRDLPMAVEVIADMLTSSVLDEGEFETERGVILEELSMAQDDPADVVNERIFEAVLGEHPLGRPVGGSPDDIRGVGRDAVWRHYRTNYRPQDLVVTAAGALDHDALVAGVERAVTAAGWNLGVPASPAPRRPGVPAPVGPGRTIVLSRPIEQANLIVGMPGILATDERRFVMGVLGAVLGGGMSSRLFQEVREKRGLAYAVYSFSAAFSDAGVFGLYAGCSPERAREVATLMLDELHRLADHGITDEELRRAVGQLSGGAALALEDSDTRMSRLGRAEITMGQFADLDENLRRLSEVTPADVQSLARDLAARPVSVAAVGAMDDDLKGLG
ncbi:MAG TPA: pitrilysin family protein [Microbacteriaceae bacterium]|nr:pitrilysin family protein [Microbacteriaceae bacterium]